MPFDPLHTCRDFAGLIRSMAYFRRYRRLHGEFGFDAWHIRSPFPRRPYKRRVVELVDRFAPHTVVEIGCGLGEIVARSSAPCRFGFDREEAVVRASRALHGGEVVFQRGDLLSPEEIAVTVGGKIDVLVAVNWPHMLTIDEIAGGLARLHALAPLQILVIDTIRPGRCGYQYHHSRSDLARLGEIAVSICGHDGIRDLHAVRFAATGA